LERLFEVSVSIARGRARWFRIQNDRRRALLTLGKKSVMQLGEELAGNGVRRRGSIGRIPRGERAAASNISLKKEEKRRCPVCKGRCWSQCFESSPPFPAKTASIISSGKGRSTIAKALIRSEKPRSSTATEIPRKTL